MATSVGVNPVSDLSGFVKSLFTVILTTTNPYAANGEIATWQNMLLYMSQNDDPAIATSLPGYPAVPPELYTALQDVGSQWNSTPSYFTRGKCRDTRLGGNDAINSYPQFNETDDVAEHPFLSTNINDPKSGMGRVYSEVYDDQQQLMFLTFGVPQYNNLASFYSNAVFDDLAKLMNNGQISSGSSVGLMLGEVLTTFVLLPAMPLVYLYRLVQGVFRASITKYYEFQSAMPLYYRAVNSIIIHLSINMGLVPDAFTQSQTGQTLLPDTPKTASAMAELMGQSVAEGSVFPGLGMPEFFDKFGFDIYRIMLRKYLYMKQDDPMNAQNNSDMSLINSPSVDNGPTVNSADLSATTANFSRQFITGLASSLYDASLYIGFRIEKGVDTSESFSNETGESSISQIVNAKAQEAIDRKNSFAGGNLEGAGFIKSAWDAISGVLSGAANAAGLATPRNILAGSGKIDFPEIWKSSTFSRSYTFNMSLRSPYGDPVSILQNLYIPLALLLGGSMPRSIGQSAYTAPFVCRAYCKGMFAVPLGMISHVTIKRGADQFGWSTQRLPTCIDVSFEIKDLSPAMFLAIGDGTATSAITAIFGANSPFQEYLLTLSGIGLAERLLFFRNIRRKAATALSQIRHTKLSPYYWATMFGNSLPGRIINTFTPNPRLPTL